MLQADVTARRRRNKSRVFARLAYDVDACRPKACIIQQKYATVINARSGAKRPVFGVCNSGIVVVGAETAMFHVLKITVYIVTQPSSDALPVAFVRTAMKNTDVRDMRLLLCPHLIDIFSQIGLFEADGPGRSPVTLLSAGTAQFLQHKCGVCCVAYIHLVAEKNAECVGALIVRATQGSVLANWNCG